MYTLIDLSVVDPNIKKAYYLKEGSNVIYWYDGTNYRRLYSDPSGYLFQGCNGKRHYCAMSKLYELGVLKRANDEKSTALYRSRLGEIKSKSEWYRYMQNFINKAYGNQTDMPYYWFDKLQKVLDLEKVKDETR